MSGIDQTEEEKKDEGKTNEIHNALEKIIKLDRKNSTFDFVDDLHNIKIKIKSGQSNNGVPPTTTKNEHSLRAYWRHASNFYFKKIDEGEFARLDYLKLMLNAQIKDPKQLYYDWDTYLAINEVLDLKKDFGSRLQAQDQDNFLKHLFIDFTYAHSGETGDKKFVNRMRQIVKDKQALVPRNRNEKHYEAELQKETRKLDEMIAFFHEEDSNEEDDEIKRELNARMAELETINVQNKDRLKDLTEKIHLEVKNKTLLYFVNGMEDPRLYNFRNKQVLENALVASKNFNRVDLQVDFLRSIILRLDRKQVAESISKIISCDRYRSDYRFRVVFEEALNLIPEVFTEETLLQLNDLREFTLLKFYNVSLKSMYTNISHVATGFDHVLKRRNQENQLKTKDLIEVMKKTKVSDEVLDKFEEFEMCHHCKQLYDKQILVGCSYRSSKMGFPVSTPSYVDPYVQQIVQSKSLVTSDDSNNNSNRQFATRKKNNYMIYTRKGNEYVCLRKYCKTCLKQSYDSIDKSGLCPFCQGVCFCTRCLRNDMITKFKTIYSQYGGDINQIQELSLFETLVTKSTSADRSQSNIRSEDEIPSPHSRKLLRRKGRPKKAPSYRPKSNLKVYNHMKELREQMEQCRLICHLVKRRQKQKLKIFNRHNDLFRQKIELVDQEINLLKKFNLEKDSPHELSTNTIEQEEENFVEPPKRKLRKVR